MGANIQTLVLNVLKGQYPWDQTNQINIILITKVKYPLYPIDYRPISLCNVMYKIIAKILNNRLVGVLYYLISANQAAFVKGRSIMDNAMMDIDIMHHIYRKSNLNLSLKVDMAKAFDIVDRNYLHQMLLKF